MAWKRAKSQAETQSFAALNENMMSTAWFGARLIFYLLWDKTGRRSEG